MASFPVSREQTSVRISTVSMQKWLRQYKQLHHTRVVVPYLFWILTYTTVKKEFICEGHLLIVQLHLPKRTSWPQQILWTSMLVLNSNVNFSYKGGHLWRTPSLFCLQVSATNVGLCPYPNKRISVQVLNPLAKAFPQRTKHIDWYPRSIFSGFNRVDNGIKVFVEDVGCRTQWGSTLEKDQKWYKSSYFR